jgi:nitroreductase
VEFTEVLRRRRMIRHYLEQPVDPEVIDRVVAAGLRAPSAGYSQGYALLVLTEPDDRTKFWAVTETPQETASWPPEVRAGAMRAPVIAVTLSCKRAYLERYAQPDKGWTDRDESRWPVPYWHIDTGMASLLILLGAVDHGLAACFFGVPREHWAALRKAFAVPEHLTPIGAISLGYRAQDRRSPSLRRGRRSMSDVVAYGSF